MRQAARRGLLTVMATGGVLASTAGYAYADAGAMGAATDSPGVGSGNAVQVPIDIPVNACGNTINVVGLLNPAYGNNCHNASHRSGTNGGSGGGGSVGQGNGGSTSYGGARHSPGVGSGNAVQIPIDIPVNACGNTATVVGGANPAFGNQCANHATPPPPGTGTPPPENCSCTPPPPGRHLPPPPPPQAQPPVIAPVGLHRSPPPPQAAAVIKPAPMHAVLASTGAGDTMLLLPLGAAMAAGGLVLYRRSRPGER